MTLDQQTSGERVYDINSDGMAHYGLYPDWIEDLRMIAGDQIVKEMGRGAEAYLADVGARRGDPPGVQVRGGRRALHQHVAEEGAARPDRAAAAEGARQAAALARARVDVLRARAAHAQAGTRRRRLQPPRARVALIATNARSHRAGGVQVRDRMRRASAIQLQARRQAATASSTASARAACRYVALASKGIAKSGRKLRRYLRLADLR